MRSLSIKTPIKRKPGMPEDDLSELKGSSTQRHWVQKFSCGELQGFAFIEKKLLAGDSPKQKHIMEKTI